MSTHPKANFLEELNGLMPEPEVAGREKNMTEAAWLRKRFKSVQEAVSKAYEDVDAVDVPIPGLESLSGAALQEAQRLRKAEGS